MEVFGDRQIHKNVLFQFLMGFFLLHFQVHGFCSVALKDSFFWRENRV